VTKPTDLRINAVVGGSDVKCWQDSTWTLTAIRLGLLHTARNLNQRFNSARMLQAVGSCFEQFR